MGRPGSGKGTQAKILSDRLDCKVFSTGGRLREITKQNSTLGREVKKTIDSGNLIPFWLASYLFEGALLDLEDEGKIIFDGVGRREAEAKLFVEVNEWLKRDFMVVYLDVSEETVTERINKRSKKDKRADDDDIQERFKEFNKHTVPALDFFRSIDKVIDIDGEPTEEDIAKEIWEKISKIG